jgi:hypothetical protein
MTDLILTQKQLQEILEYDSATGIFLWQKNGYKKRISRVAGCAIPTGYIVIGINKKTWMAHRLAWIYVNGDIPSSKFIDHINRDRSDNRIDNLRLVDPSENSQNQSIRRQTFEPRNRDRHYIAAKEKIELAKKNQSIGKTPTNSF